MLFGHSRNVLWCHLYSWPRCICLTMTFGFCWSCICLYSVPLSNNQSFLIVLGKRQTGFNHTVHNDWNTMCYEEHLIALSKLSFNAKNFDNYEVLLFIQLGHYYKYKSALNSELRVTKWILFCLQMAFLSLWNIPCFNSQDHTWIPCLCLSSPQMEKWAPSCTYTAYTGTAVGRKYCCYIMTHLFLTFVIAEEIERH